MGTDASSCSSRRAEADTRRDKWVDWVYGKRRARCEGHGVGIDIAR